MKNDEVREIAKEYRQIVIFGYSGIGEYIYQQLKETGQDAEVVFCDNIKQKQGVFGEHRVFSVSEAADRYPKALYLLTSLPHEGNMKKQLKDCRISENQIYLCVTEEAVSYMSSLKRKLKYTPMKRIQFEVDIASHCNLNCKCCSQFSPIAEPELIEPALMERDFQRLGELFNGEAQRIYLIGGEPLLHPQMPECMRIARKYFPKGKISIFSNGILLKNAEEEFWSVCKEYEISIIVTKYPIALDYEEIQKTVERYGIEFEFFGTSKDFKYMTNLGLDIEGKQNPEDSFADCVEANNCVKLKNGRLYTCTRPAVIDRFNHFFHTELQAEDRDSIDIFQAVSGEEILNFLAKPIPFCRYCNVHGEKTAMEWGRTEGRMEEWM